MAKKIDIVNKEVQDLREEYPELIDIMYNIGVTEMKPETARSPISRFLLLPGLADSCGVSTKAVVDALLENGFELDPEPPAFMLEDRHIKMPDERLADIPGHPMNTFVKENEALTGLIDSFSEEGDDGLLTKIREISIHYEKKNDLLYSCLYEKYGVEWASACMLSSDLEILDELDTVINEADRDERGGKKKRLMR